MARTELGAALTRRHRSLQLGLRAGLLQQLLTLWGTVDPTNLAGTIGIFASAASLLVQQRHRDSAALSARYFTEFRRAEEVAGAATIITPDPPVLDLLAGWLRGAALSGIVNARRSGQSAQAAARNGFVKVSGTASNLALDGGRQVVTGAASADERAIGGWQRVASGGACAFCAMLASRGPVYQRGGGVARRSNITFAAHSGCSCSAEPVYEGSRLSPEAERYQGLWEQAQREVLPDVDGTSNDAMNAFRRLLEGRPSDGRSTAEI